MSKSNIQNENNKSTKSSSEHKEKDKTDSITRSTTLPYVLDTRVQKYVKTHYTSVSEFLREATRFHVFRIEKAIAQSEIWNLLGGPIIEGVNKMVDERMSVMEDQIHKNTKDIGGIEEETKIKLPDEDEGNEEDWQED